MHESIPRHPSGMSPKFNLGESILTAVNGPGDQIATVAAADKVRDTLSIDSLTGLLNKQGYMDKLASEIDGLQPDETVIAFVADLDGFKAVNDGLGHKAGDDLLIIVADVFTTAFKRHGDVVAHGSREDSSKVARLSGDENAAYSVKNKSNPDYRDSTPEQEAISQEIRLNEILQDAIKDTAYGKYKLKMSVGSAIYEAGDTAESLFVKADTKMFENKYRGKADALTQDDLEQLKKMIPYLEKLGHRVENWLKNAVGLKVTA